MNESDIFIIDFPNDIYDAVIAQIMEYAVISLPFTIDRMNQIGRNSIAIGNQNRIKNIFKGKLAEGLFIEFAKHNNLPINTNACSTPFYQVDRRDFLYHTTEFDIKNNFIYHQGSSFIRYTDLPALIPNRFEGDQWSQRLSPHVGNHVAYLFSFMKGADLLNNQRGKEFLELKISSEQAQYIHELYKTYKGLPQEREPFSSSEFWNEMEKRGSLDFFQLHDRPKLVLCGIADQENWCVFKDVGPNCPNHYQSEPIPNWYAKVGRNKSVNFLKGTIWGTITNKTAPIQKLKPIHDVFKDLDKDLVYAQYH